MSEQRRGAVRSEASRVAILNATAALFAEKGYEHLSIEAIAAEAGVGKQTIYRWWPTKSALVAECMIEGFLMPGGAIPLNSGDIRSDLEAWVVAVFRFTEDPDNDVLIRSLVAAASDNGDIGRRLHDRLGASSELTERLAAAVRAGEVRPDLPIADVGEVLVGAVVLRILTREPTDEKLPTRLVDIVLGGPRPVA
ncbi:TetR/AcrR family transcriptional regulator [Amnibacterium flavum]|uniref:TetR family transcriptional regulator n=1 Tax=Amnibacterium flavum TaxID=2173173 RepID=A0A2V1HWS8_9MICO|nr:TetR/AcrR family transcriptional regulator [Amnibacterium flavum]PVZ95689.1 TetR family transcriptional regulator [Amnibacterium flavum]